MPSKDILSAVAKRNPDGLGFATKTRCFKSMDFETFYKELCKVDVNEDVILHARYATHGSVKISNCHPFFNEETNTYFFHNGILSIHPREDMTDSETAFRDILVPVIKQYGLNSKELAEAVENIIGASKFAMMQDGNIRLFGRYTEVDGILYSNLHFVGCIRDFRTYLRFAS